MNKQEYRDICLNSEHWRNKKEEALKIHGTFCFVCKCTARLDIHHIRYDNLYNENIKDDLVVLCRFHHEDYHNYHELASAKNFKKYCDYWKVKYSKPLPTLKKISNYHGKKKLGTWSKKQQKRYQQGIDLQKAEIESNRKRIAAKSKCG